MNYSWRKIHHLCKRLINHIFVPFKIKHWVHWIHNHDYLKKMTIFICKFHSDMSICWMMSRQLQYFSQIHRWYKIDFWKTFKNSHHAFYVQFNPAFIGWIRTKFSLDIWKSFFELGINNRIITFQMYFLTFQMIWTCKFSNWHLTIDLYSFAILFVPV